MSIERHENLPRAEWDRWHDHDLTCSKLAGLLGLDRFTSPLRVFHEKAGQIELLKQGDNPVLRRGRLFESAVGAAVAEERPQWRIEKANVYLRDPDLKFGATPDFFIYGDPRGLGLLQTKTCAPAVFASDWKGVDKAPFGTVIQVLGEAILVDPAFCVVAALCIDPWNVECAIVEVPRHPATEQKIRDAIVRFWKDVAAGREPEPDYYLDKDLIALLSPHEQPGATFDARGDNELISALIERGDLKERMARDEKRCKAIEALVMDRMGEAESIVGVDDFRVTWRTQHRAGYTVAPKDSRVLRILDRRADEEAAA
jgi:predicted phage-related endonuclease